MGLARILRKLYMFSKNAILAYFLSHAVIFMIWLCDFRSVLATLYFSLLFDIVARNYI